MTDRTYGETRDCRGGRFWSEMMAQAIGGHPVEAMCLGDIGTNNGKYTTGRQTCLGWMSGHLGAVDEPPDYGEGTRRAYAEEAAEEQAR